MCNCKKLKIDLLQYNLKLACKGITYYTYFYFDKLFCHMRAKQSYMDKSFKVPQMINRKFN
ncbi:hypothetical protein BpHYR1_035423 [Brachionus plicatilis]|uniref:Uncharacterized protein n=1 Tax=Brachionus plicatilis TaxID=10195 RepID=A0A3M7QE26_BRAPC|nr:hypothetical protein BpHYR1_035423 [Brachionus plicatilis]